MGLMSPLTLKSMQHGRSNHIYKHLRIRTPWGIRGMCRVTCPWGTRTRNNNKLNRLHYTKMYDFSFLLYLHFLEERIFLDCLYLGVGESGGRDG